MKQKHLIFGIIVVLVIIGVIFISEHLNAGLIEKDLTCSKDEECVIAIRSDVCCSCFEVYSKKQVDKNPRLMVYESGKDYPKPNCEGVTCAECKQVSETICYDNTCQQRETVAIMMYNQENLKETLEICNEKEFCIFSVAKEARNKNELNVSLELCLSLDRLRDGCFFETALTETVLENEGDILTNMALEKGLNICKKIKDEDQKGRCYFYIALNAQTINKTTALEICNIIKPGFHHSQCKQLIT